MELVGFFTGLPLICASILTLVSCGFNNSLILHDALRHIGLPRAGIGRALVQEIPTRLGLLPVQLDTEFKMLFGSLELPLDCQWVLNIVVDSLPR